MRVVVAYNREAMIEFDLWLHSSGHEDDDANLLLESYLIDFRQQLEMHDGIHPESIRNDRVDPPVFRVPFIRGLQIEYTCVEVVRWFWRSYKLVTIERFRRVP
jgi:hypothetical protein